MAQLWSSSLAVTSRALSPFRVRRWQDKPEEEEGVNLR